ncbi:hypothetical protein Tco_1565751, partial [Tanacetum coccineum]
IDDLEKQLKETKQTFGKVILTLVERVKTLEVALKRKTKRVLLSDSEEEETEAQGRKTHDLDPLVSLVQEIVTPSKTINASGEEHVEDISPTTLEAGAILTKVHKIKSVDKGKIIKQGRKGVYQIVRENGTDMVYISFRAMLTDISRDDLTELYRIVMKKHGMNEPEDEFEKSADVYMLIERKYPLSAEVCKAMLDKKLQGGKPDEDCYKLLKMMEKQAGIRK